MPRTVKATTTKGWKVGTPAARGGRRCRSGAGGRHAAGRPGRSPRGRRRRSSGRQDVAVHGAQHEAIPAAGVRRSHRARAWSGAGRRTSHGCGARRCPRGLRQPHRPRRPGSFRVVGRARRGAPRCPPGGPHEEHPAEASLVRRVPRGDRPGDVVVRAPHRRLLARRGGIGGALADPRVLREGRVELRCAPRRRGGGGPVDQCGDEGTAGPRRSCPPTRGRRPTPVAIAVASEAVASLKSPRSMPQR